MRRTTWPRRLLLGVVATAVALGAASAAAAPTAADLEVAILVSPDKSRLDTTRIVPNGGTSTVAGLNFQVGLMVASEGPDPSVSKARIELPAGLRWGLNAPRLQRCTSDATSGTCEARIDGTFNQWGWDVIADAAGSYTLKAQIIESSQSDPDTSDNATTVTVVVTQAAGGGSGGGSGGSSGSAAVASAVKVTPAAPKAGSTLVASVRVTKGGSPVKPTGIMCSASIGKTKVKGGAKSSSGVASCLFKTPKSGKGKTLLGSVSFSAGGQSFAKQFAARLR